MSKKIKLVIILLCREEGFAYYFSRLDIKGLERVLSDDQKNDGGNLEFIALAFDNLKSAGITSFKVFPGVCIGCYSCKGFTFIDEKTGVFLDIIIEHNDKEITFVEECLGLRNKNTNLKKKDRWIIDPLRRCCFGNKE